MKDKPQDKPPHHELEISTKGKNLQQVGTDSRPGEGEIWLVYSVLTDPNKKSHSGKLWKRKKKEETVHMFFTSQTNVTPSFGTDGISHHQSIPSLISRAFHERTVQDP